MELILIASTVIIGLISWGVINTLKERLKGKEEQIKELREKERAWMACQRELGLLKEEIARSDEKILALSAAKEAFKSLSNEALEKNNLSFLELAKGQLTPIRTSLDSFNTKIEALEKARHGAYTALSEQVRSLLDVQFQLKKETENLGRALRAPIVRGRWGEIQLKRVVEMAGMLGHCDFYEQESVNLDEGRLRPDMIVRLPGGKNIVVDAKAPLSAYLEAIECTKEEERLFKLKEHARQVRAHILSLGKKSYWEQFSPTPEFVVLFLPGEIFFSSALEQDPSLIEMGAEQKVILATPTTLIAVLRAVAYGWHQEILSEEVARISQMGKDLYKRVSDMADHWNHVGKSLRQAVVSYNKAVGSLESRVLVNLRKFQELHLPTVQDKIEPMITVDEIPRQILAEEMLQGPQVADPLLANAALSSALLVENEALGSLGADGGG